MEYDVVIVGGGAGGLELASKLGRKYGRKLGIEKVLLIDRSMVHVWKPTLHEVAVGTLNPQQEGMLYTGLAWRNHFSFRLGELREFYPKDKKLVLAEILDDNGQVLVPKTTIGFKYCVLAIGSGSNSFGTKGFEHTFVLDNLANAQRFQKHLFAQFFKTAYSDRKVLNLAIIGAGATGVELAAEMREAQREIQQVMLKSQRFELNINLIEAAPRILSALSENISQKASQVLQDKGVKILTQKRVLEITPTQVLMDGDTAVDADIVVWAAGIKASEYNKQFGLETNHINQFVVNAKLQTSDENVYALGDCSSLKIDDKVIPATAQAAHQEAHFLSRLLWAKIQNQPFDDTFKYQDKGALVALGDHAGAGNMMYGVTGKSIFIEGLFAKQAHMALHLMHHVTVMGVVKTVILALARLAQKRIFGRLKLH